MEKKRKIALIPPDLHVPEGEELGMPADKLIGMHDYYIVLGAGSHGSTVAREIAKMGHDNIKIITPEEAKGLSDEKMIVIPPEMSIPRPEAPMIHELINHAKRYQEVPKSGKEKRREARKKKNKRRFR